MHLRVNGGVAEVFQQRRRQAGLANALFIIWTDSWVHALLLREMLPLLSAQSSPQLALLMQNHAKEGNCPLGRANYHYGHMVPS